MNRQSVKLIVLFIFLFVSFASCRTDKTPLEEIYVAFKYDGPKIDSTVLNDQIIFKNIDGGPTLFVPNYSTGVCENYIHLGTFPLEDTLTWHLRLVDPDGSPAHFQVYITSENQIVLLNETLHFVKPTPHDFVVTTETCNNKTVIVIGNQ